MTFASGRTTLRLTPTSDQSIGRRQGPSPGAATGLQPRRHPGRRPEAPGRPRPRPRPQDRHRARQLHRATSGLTVRCFRNDRRPDGQCPVYVAMLVSAAASRPDRCAAPPAASRPLVTSVATGIGLAAPADMTTRAARGRTRVGNRRDPAQQRTEFPVPADRVYAVARGHHLIFGYAHTTGSSTVAALVCSPSRTPRTAR